MAKLPDKDRLKSAFVATVGNILKTEKSPEEALGELFADVQNLQVFTDGKTFADLVPRRRMKDIRQEYLLERDAPDFSLSDFVMQNFFLPDEHGAVYIADKKLSVDEHIDVLWKFLKVTNRRNKGSLIALPYPYIVPGGRFREQFYWDSFFIMLGLEASDNWQAIEYMIKNFAYMIRKFGFIPTANRTYFLSRSQPPFFSQMLRILARHKGRAVLVEYLPYLLIEYRFWMRGRSKLSKAEHRAFARVVEMPNGTLMNRYYDNKTTPRPESLREDTQAAHSAKNRESDRLYLHLRAAAESGWDFSSRWFTDPMDIHTIHTADIVPVDLNVLLYELEKTISEAYEISRQPILARRFMVAAERRARAMHSYCWNDEVGFFEDYNFHQGGYTGQLSLAGVFPLYAKIASPHQADRVAEIISRKFLKDGGLVATLVDNGQQWDAPNGWAPLQWIVIQGLRNYGYQELAEEIKHRWVATNLKVFDKKRKLVEKYNVVDVRHPGGGGEYTLQDGFGWTNGVLATLLAEGGSREDL